MIPALQLQCYQVGKQSVWLYVPQPGEVQRLYYERKEADIHTPFPYWTQVWPAALAMGEFISRQPQFVAQKQVLELAAGLGLPSLLAARYAQNVCCSDYLPEAVSVIQASVTYNQLQNVTCRLLDWHQLPDDLNPEVLLLSDINYEPMEFEVLYPVLTGFLAKGTTILLSTPQRLMAKSFIDFLLPWCVHQEELAVQHQGQTVLISVLVLKDKSTEKTTPSVL